MRYTRVAPIPFLWRTHVASGAISIVHGESYPCLIYEVTSYPGRALAFNILLECGAAYKDVPLHAFGEGIFTRNAQVHQPWGCLGESFTVWRTPIFEGCRPKISGFDIDREFRYRFSISWLDGPYADDPAEDKYGHVFEDPEHRIICVPNNHVLDWGVEWYRDEKAEMPPLKRNKERWLLP